MLLFKKLDKWQCGRVSVLAGVGMALEVIALRPFLELAYANLGGDRDKD